MKNTTIITMAALLLGSSGLMADPTTAFTKPSGFVTHTLKAGQFNLIGLSLHEAVTIAGSFTLVATSAETVTLTDANVDFDSVLSAGQMYIIEITEAADSTLIGMVQEFNQWDMTSVTTPLISGLVAGDKYQIRRAETISDIFGAENSAGLTEATNIGGADVIWVPKVGGGFDKFYYSPGGGFGGGTAGWKNDSGQDAGDEAIVYTDAIYIQSKAAIDKDLILTGSVKTNATILILSSGFNFVGLTYPVGATLANSGLEDSLKQATNLGSADVLWIMDTSGGYEKYYYSPGGGFGGGSAGWKDSSGDEAGATLMPSGFIIQRKSGATNAVITPPPGYENL